MQETRDILRKIRRLEIRTRRLVDAMFAGQYQSVFKGRGMNFQEVREYTPGDEIRMIDWNVTARMDAPFVKKFTEEREMTVMLLVDVSASGGFGSIDRSKRELAAEVASILAFSAIQNNDKVGLLLFSDRVELFIPPKKGRMHTLRLIREMLYFEPVGTKTDLAVALDYLNRVITRRAVVFLISDFYSQDFAKPLAVTGRRHDCIAIPIYDPGEENIPDVGIITFEDAETGRQIEIHTGDAGAMKKYGAMERKRRQELEKLLLSRGIDSIALRTDQDYLIPLRGFFKKRERRQVAA